MTIVVLKLVSGEEIIAKDLGVGENYEPKFASPRVLQMVQTGQGVQAGLVPWVLSNPDADVEILTGAIVAKTTPTSDVEDAYIRQTSKLDLSVTKQSKIVTMNQ